MLLKEEAEAAAQESTRRAETTSRSLADATSALQAERETTHRLRAEAAEASEREASLQARLRETESIVNDAMTANASSTGEAEALRKQIDELRAERDSVSAAGRQSAAKLEEKVTALQRTVDRQRGEIQSLVTKVRVCVQYGFMPASPDSMLHDTGTGAQRNRGTCERSRGV